MKADSPQSFQTLCRQGSVQVLEGPVVLALVTPEVFTEGWAKHTVDAGLKDGRFDGLIPLPGGGRIGLQSFVDACPEAKGGGHPPLRLRFVLSALAPAFLLHVRVVVHLPYGDWAGSPYQLGVSGGRVPIPPPDSIRIAEGDSLPLVLGPAGSLGGLTLRLEAPGLHTVLQDNRQWTPYLQAFVTRNEPADAVWEWKAGLEKAYEFTLAFNRPQPLP